MDSPRITYSSRPDTTPEAEVNVLASVYRFILDSRAKKMAAEPAPEPDGHDGTKLVKDILRALGLSPWGTTDYEVFRAVARVARNVGVTPYNVDKLFWLIGSGNFYEDPHVGNRGRIGSKKEEFIEVAKAQLEERQTPIQGGAR